MARIGSGGTGNDTAMRADESQGLVSTLEQASSTSPPPLVASTAVVQSAVDSKGEDGLNTMGHTLEAMPPANEADAMTHTLGESNAVAITAEVGAAVADKGEAMGEETTAVVVKEDESKQPAVVGVEAGNPTEQEAAGGEEYGEEDGGVIRCICECDDDDGFTIQCDRCLVWQHCACFGMSQASVPEEYHCERCNPRPVDVEFAKAHQQRRRDAEARKLSLEKNIRRHSQANAAAAASFYASMAMDGVQAGLESEIDGPTDSQQQRGQQVGNSVAPSGGISRSRKPSQQLDLSNVGYNSIDGPPSATTTPASAKSYRKRGGGPKTGARKTPNNEGSSGNALTPRTAAAMASNAPLNGSNASQAGRGEDRLEMEESMADRMEGWQVEFTPTSRNIISDDSIRTSLSSAMLDFEHGSPLKADRGTGNRIIAPVIGRKVKTLVNVGALSDSSKGLADQEDSSTTPSVAVEYGLAAIGNECIPVELSIGSLSDCSQKTYVKQVSELASAGIFNSLLHVAPLPSEPQRPWSASRTFSKPVMHGLFADASIPAGCFIAEYTGEIDNADHYRRDPVNQYQWTGTSKPSVHLFPPPLNLCIDARRFGSTSRFARFSCHPNAVLRPIVLRGGGEEGKEEGDGVPSSPLADGKAASAAPAKQGGILFGLFAITDIPRTHEITLGWEWDDAHIVHILPQLVRNPTLGVVDSSMPAFVPSSSAASNPRIMERERRNALIATLLEKGDFPYIETSFSGKMNSILTVLLSTCLCACIGSAAAPNGHGGMGSNVGNSTASSNNVKRQDCAILQMLRLSQGMGMLNVSIPGSNSSGKSSRKSKAPDFEPLVGKRRWWRPEAMPLTPNSLQGGEEGGEERMSKREGCHRSLDVRYKLLPGGKVGRVDDGDFEEAVNKDRLEARLSGSHGNDEEGGEESEGEGDESGGSDASSLTEPLSGRSGDEEGEEEMLLEGSGITIGREAGGAIYFTHTALPPKKRVSGTRLKAVCSGGEDSEVEYKGRKKQSGRRDVVREEATRKKQKRVALAAQDREHKASSRKEGGKKKRSKRAYEPSSPLTSAPSEEDESGSESSGESDESVSTPVQSRLTQSSKKRGLVREESSESEVVKMKRKRRADAEAKKKALLVKKRRRELLGDLDMQSDDSSGPDVGRGASAKESREASPSLAKKRAKTRAVKQIVESEESGSGAEQERQGGQEEAGRAEPAFPALSNAPEPALAIDMEVDSMRATAPTAEPAPPPPLAPIELPKAKLSLADYKKRLAERKTTASATSTPLPTPTLPGPTSPEKKSLPPTPSSASATQTGFAFPSTSSSLSESASTPTTVKTEWAPPAPRFPRPSTPPRVTTPAVMRSASVTTPAPLVQSPSEQSPVPRAPLPSPDKFAPLPTSPLPPTLPLTSMAPTPLEQEGRAASAGQAAARPPVPRPAIHPGFAPIRPPLHSKSSDSNPSPPSSRMTDQAKQSHSPPSAATTANPATFNPPRGPRALIQSPFAVSTGPTAASLPATSPTLGPVRSNSGSIGPTTAVPPPSLAAPPAVQAEPPARHRRQSSSFDSSPSTQSMRNPSPTRPALVSPAPSVVSSYSSSAIPPPAAPPPPPIPASSSALNDFANVPKGPARMREREREREMRERERGDERDYREPLPPLRDQWEREREWEHRERDRDWMERDVREHSYDRRRTTDEDDRMDYMPPRPPPPPFASRGGGGVGRGAFPGPARPPGLSSPWPARARTRGRGSRGGWR